MIEAHRRHLAATKLAAGGEPAVTADHLVIAIDQDRDIEAKGPDAVGDFANLPFRMTARVGGVGFQLVDPTIDDL